MLSERGGHHEATYHTATICISAGAGSYLYTDIMAVRLGERYGDPTAKPPLSVGGHVGHGQS